MARFAFDFSYPSSRGRDLPATATIGLDASGVPGVVSVAVWDGAGFVRKVRGDFFDHAEAYLCSRFWDDVVAQAQAIRREHARVAGLAAIAHRALNVGAFRGVPLTDAEFRRAGELLEQFEGRIAEMEAA